MVSINIDMRNIVGKLLTNQKYGANSRYNKYRNHYYNKYESRYLNNKFYLSFLENINRKSNFNETESEINLTPSLQINIASPRDVKKAFGKPIFTFIKKIEKEKIVVNLYKLKLLDNKAIAELHFFRNKLYYFTYNFIDAGGGERAELHRKVVQKYKSFNSNFDLANETCIIDSNKNCLVFNDDVDFSISYFCLSKNEAYNFFKSIIQKEKFYKDKKISHKERMFYKLV